MIWRGLLGAYRHDGAGRPPTNPLGILKALIVKRVRNVPSDRELYRRLCDIARGGKGFPLKLEF